MANAMESVKHGIEGNLSTIDEPNIFSELVIPNNEQNTESLVCKFKVF